MSTLAEMTLLVSRLLQTTVDSISTDGSPTTLIDTILTQGAGVFDDGTIWFSDRDGLETASVVEWNVNTDTWTGFEQEISTGTMRVITDWDESTDTFTFATVGPTVTAGERYSVAGNEYPRWALAQAVNRALEKDGNVIAFDTSLTTVANQESYSLPASVRNVLEIEIAQSTSAPYRYKTHHAVKERGGKIYFEDYTEPSGDGYTIRLRYLDAHALLEDDADSITSEIHDNVIKYRAAIEAIRWKKQRRGGDIDEDQLAMLIRDHKEAMQLHPPPATRDQRTPAFGMWGDI